MWEKSSLYNCVQEVKVLDVFLGNRGILLKINLPMWGRLVRKGRMFLLDSKAKKSD
jgi:hypothetical protein